MIENKHFDIIPAIAVVLFARIECLGNFKIHKTKAKLFVY